MDVPTLLDHRGIENCPIGKALQDTLPCPQPLRRHADPIPRSHLRLGQLLPPHVYASLRNSHLAQWPRADPIFKSATHIEASRPVLLLQEDTLRLKHALQLLAVDLCQKQIPDCTTAAIVLAQSPQRRKKSLAFAHLAASAATGFPRAVLHSPKRHREQRPASTRDKLHHVDSPEVFLWVRARRVVDR
ncbi:hypothetical protein S7711_10600 [Stachybotrys chartarum IBT 7711]|uniref:Uncharacterized protein n=1 Tax=Stachybotrys chartarum (strain CBS 109288 / IBT 7711) TaxID=1280523 RepID=A0A084AYW7_STACB|nr:hypothetical protein S7711_10600 [Stachybotrys chartarum IBT 7711]